MGTKEELFKVLPKEIIDYLEQLDLDFSRLQEIRLRVNKEIALMYDNREIIGRIYKKVTKQHLNELLQYISNYSLYACQEELREGYITLQGGHRIGVCGKIIIENGVIKTIKNITFINIRLAKEVIGCSDKIIDSLVEKDRVKHTLIISPPRCGKTTLLRDIVRQLSNGTKKHRGRNIGLIDERSEIAACYLGVPQNEVGLRTDVLDSCPKALGMLMLIRAMSPEVVVVDEIGAKQDIEALQYVINSGCSVICTIHGFDKASIANKIPLEMFEKIIVLSNKNYIGEIIEE